MNTELIALCIQTGVPVLVIGDSGIGKTEVAGQIAKKLNRLHESWSMAQMGDEQFMGLMVPNRETGVTDLYPVSLGRTLMSKGFVIVNAHTGEKTGETFSGLNAFDRAKLRAHELGEDFEAQALPSPGGVIILDELASARPRTRGAALTLIQSRMLGSQKLPDNVSFVCLSNDPAKAEGGSDFRAAVSSRFCWDFAEYDVKATANYFRGGPGFMANCPVIPDDWKETRLQGVMSLIASFIERNPALANAEPPPHDASKPFPCPRTWENAGKLLAALRSIERPYNSDLGYKAVAGCVGEGAATSFMTWIREMNLPDPEHILGLAQEKKVDIAVKMIPERADRMSVSLDSIAAAAVRKHASRADRWKAAWKIIGELLDSHQDIAMSSVDILGSIAPPDGTFPEEAVKILQIRRQANLAIR